VSLVSICHGNLILSNLNHFFQAFSFDLTKTTTPMSKPSWKEVAEKAQEHRDASIKLVKPAVPDVPSELPLNVTEIPKHLLTTEEVIITETTPEDLVKSLASGKLTSTGVTNAFLRRAGIAQKLVGCLRKLSAYV
jgi:amidase